MISVPPEVDAVLAVLRGKGHEAFPVGGCVRDSLLGQVPGDWDVCTSALPEEVLAAFPADNTVPTGLRHGTITVLSGGKPIEVTTFRTEEGYSDSRRPDSVTFVRSLAEDLMRRDFTVNAMALDESGNVIDRFGGQDDLRAHTIRCVGEPAARFREDALRILRALRFASKLDFTIEAETARAAADLKPRLAALSAERVWKELSGILMGPGCGRVLREYGGILTQVLPELGAAGISRRSAAISAAPTDLCLRLSLLLYGLDSQKADGVLRRLRCDNASRLRTLRLLSALTVPLPASRVERLQAAQTLGWADALLVFGLRDKKAASELSALKGGNPCLTVRDLAVSGDDLLKLGVSAGAAVGSLLKKLLNAVWRKDAENTRESLLRLAEAMIHEEPQRKQPLPPIHA